MSKLKIAVSDSCPDCFTTQRECIYINESRNIDVAAGNDSNLLIVFYVQIMPDDFVMQLHRF